MEPIFYVMAILGCGDAGACRDARLVPVRYASAGHCRAAIGTMLSRHTDLDFPLLRATCRKTVRRAVAR